MLNCFKMIFVLAMTTLGAQAFAQTNLTAIASAKVGTSMRVYCMVDGKYPDNRLDLTVTERISSTAFYAKSKFISGMAGADYSLVNPDTSIVVGVTNTYVRVRIGAVWRKPGVPQHKLIRDYYIAGASGNTLIYADWTRTDLLYVLNCKVY